ncbi:hypothetical protein [Rhodanobacter denitrificans]|nr:hypothetical protein [Rhodanobacter denitrificans]
MPASITTGEPEQIEPDLFVQASKRRHGHDFSQCAPASLLRRACLLAHACRSVRHRFQRGRYRPATVSASQPGRLART